MTDDTPSPGGLDGVGAIVDSAEEVTLPPEMEGLNPAPLDAASIDDERNRGGEPDFGRGIDPPGPSGDDDPTPPVQRAAAEPLNDFGNGRRVQIHFGRDLMFVPRVGWFVWNGMYWKKDSDELAVRALAHRIGALIEQETQYLKVPAEEEAMRDRRDVLTAEIGALSDIPSQKRTAEDRAALREAKAERSALDHTLDQIGGQIGKRLTHAKSAGNTASLTNMLTEAAVALARPLEALDVEPLAINTESGILRFEVVSDPDAGMSKVGQVTLHPHDRAALITKMMPVRYDPKAVAPSFDKFFERIQPDGMVRDFLQRWFGLGMTGIPVQLLCIFFGDGKNGKSVLVDCMCKVFGDYTATANIKTLVGEDRRDGSSATPDLVPLIGARLVRASEPKRGTPWNEEMIKQMTGGEKMLIRPLFGASVEAEARFKLIVQTNDKPEILGEDLGIWRRLRIVPFEVEIPDAELIEKAELDPILYAERDGIFAWAVRGLLDYLEIGLQEPEHVLLATQELRDEKDFFGAFLDEACLVTGEVDHRISTGELVNAFHFWMSIGKRGVFKDQKVSKGLAKKSRVWRSPRTGQKFTPQKSGGFMYYLGIQLQPVFARNFDNAPRDNSGRPVLRRDPSGTDDA